MYISSAIFVAPPFLILPSLARFSKRKFLMTPTVFFDDDDAAGDVCSWRGMMATQGLSARLTFSGRG
jgi:hypothetical protein